MSPDEAVRRRRLVITPKTVGNHIEHIYTKIGETTRAGAALYAMRNGLVDHTTDPAEPYQ